MFSCLEMWVGEADEDFGELALLEKVGEELHRVGSEYSGVAVQSLLLVLCSEGLDPVLNELCHGYSDLESWRFIRAKS